MKRKGFTIVELLAVVAVLATLVTIVVTAAGGAIKNSRDQRAETMRVSFEQAIAAYHAQDIESKWPAKIEEHIDDPYETVELTGTDADAVLREVVGKGFGKYGPKQVLIDASALLVCNASYADNPKAFGIDFPKAASRNSKDRVPFASMAFGYPEPEKGHFRRFKVIYHTKTDSVTVSK